MSKPVPELAMPPRLSVVIRSSNSRTGAERAVQSVLSQEDPIGAEVILADDGSGDGTADHIESVFWEAIRQGRLRLVRLERTGDPGTARNQGAAVAQGAFLAFLEPQDWWRPGRLVWLEPWLSRHDLILAYEPERLAAGKPVSAGSVGGDDGGSRSDSGSARSSLKVSDPSDAIRTLLSSAHWALTSSAVIRRTLFDEVGGFPEKSYGLRLEDYELWLRCLVRLSAGGRRERFLLAPNQHVVSESESETGHLPPPLAMLKNRVRTFRETISLLTLLRRVPPRYWSLVARRFAESGKSLIKP